MRRRFSFYGTFIINEMQYENNWIFYSKELMMNNTNQTFVRKINLNNSKPMMKFNGKIFEGDLGECKNIRIRKNLFCP